MINEITTAVNSIKISKQKLADNIQSMIVSFEKETGTTIDSITLEKKDGINNTVVKTLKIEVRI